MSKDKSKKKPEKPFNLKEAKWYDLLFLQILSYVKMDKHYIGKLWFRQFLKYGVTQILVFWVIKAPMIEVFTSLGLWYILSAFIAGIIVALIGFIVEKYFVFKV